MGPKTNTFTQDSSHSFRKQISIYFPSYLCCLLKRPLLWSSSRKRRRSPLFIPCCLFWSTSSSSSSSVDVDVVGPHRTQTHIHTHPHVHVLEASITSSSRVKRRPSARYAASAARLLSGSGRHTLMRVAEKRFYLHLVVHSCKFYAQLRQVPLS